MQHNQQNPFVPTPPDDAGAQVGRSSLKTAQWLRQAPSAAFDALLDQTDPQGGAPVSAEARANRRLCGRWLAVQRLRLRVSSGFVAERADVDERTLALLESGVASEVELPAATRERLSRVLAEATHDAGWVLDVLAVAVGQAPEREASVLQQVLAELPSPSVAPTAPAPRDDGYELFRRAIVGRDEDAWAEIYMRYQPLLISWALHGVAHADDAAQAADFADQALARAWRALTPGRFSTFPNLAALLAYLRACVTTVVIDSLRAQAGRERECQSSQADMVASPEQVVLADLDRAALWRTLAALITSPAERVILIETFISNLPPRVIQARHPQLFPDIAAVYKAKRNLLTRLERSSELQQLHVNASGGARSPQRGHAACSYTAPHANFLSPKPWLLCEIRAGAACGLAVALASGDMIVVSSALEQLCRARQPRYNELALPNAPPPHFPWMRCSSGRCASRRPT